MEKKNILIISYSFPPSNAPAAQRPYAFAKYLDKSKFNVTVLTCLNQDSSMGMSLNMNYNLEDVLVLRVKSVNLAGLRNIKKSSMKSISANKANRFKIKLLSMLQWFVFPDKAFFWLFYVLPYIFKSRKIINPDVIFSTSPLFTNHLIARFVKLFHKKAIHISDFRDYHYIENDQQTGLKKYLNKYLEKIIIKKSDFSCFISNSMKEIYAQHYPKFSDKFKTIYNGFDKDEYVYTNTISNRQKLTFFYAGSFYKGIRSPKPLLLTLEYMLNKNLINNFDFIIEIAGNFEDELVKELQCLNVFKNIVFLGVLSREAVLKKYAESHVLWLIIGNKINHYTGVPIKMYEYLGSKRPILNFTPKKSESEQIIENLNAGWNLTNDELDIKYKVETISEILKKYKSGKLNEPLDLIGIDKFLRKNQAIKLENIIYG